MSYIEAVKCVMGKPVSAIKDVLPGATSRFEEFLGDHILQTDANHFVVRLKSNELSDFEASRSSS